MEIPQETHLSLWGKLASFVRYNWAFFRFVMAEGPLDFAAAVFRGLLFKFRHRGKDLAYVAWAECGFFANLRGMIYQITTLEAQGKTPVMVSSKFAIEKHKTVLTISKNLYWSDEGHNGATNTWEYYFEPTPGLSADFGFAAVRPKDLTYQHPDFMAADSFVEDYLRHGYQSAYWAQNLGISDYPTDQYRAQMHQLLSRYAKVKAPISKKVDDFYQRHMSGHTVIGVHIRRTDSTIENYERLAVPDAVYLELIDRHPHDKVFLATDCQHTLLRMQELLKDKLIYQQATRGEDDQGIHNTWGGELSKPLLGEEVLIEALLLSKCQFFIHGNSSLNFAILGWNTALEHANVFEYMAKNKAKNHDRTNAPS